MVSARVLVGAFSMEANSFLGAQTTRADFEQQVWVPGDQMDRDAAAFAEALAGLQAGGDAPRRAGDAQAREKLAELEKAYGEFQAAMSSIVGNLKPLVEAKTAARRVVDDSENLLATSQKVVEAFEREISGRAANFKIGRAHV